MTCGYDQTTVTDTRFWTRNTTSTVSTSDPIDNRVTKTSTTFTNTYISSYYHIPSSKKLSEEQKKIKELRKKEKVLKMKKGWNSKVLEKPIEPKRPAVQLRNVCFSGRGWA